MPRGHLNVNSYAYPHFRSECLSSVHSVSELCALCDPLRNRPLALTRVRVRERPPANGSAIKRKRGRCRGWVAECRSFRVVRGEVLVS